jgi:hypothetical protein
MEDKTPKPSRLPNNLREYILIHPNDDFIPLLTKHHKSIESIFKAKNAPKEIELALFVIELNNFKGDLIRIARLCEQIQLARDKHDLMRAKSSEILQVIKELMDRASSFYGDACYYDGNYDQKEWLSELSRLFFNLKLFSNPFHYKPSSSNELNANNAVENIRHHEGYFRNFINTLYGDGKDGEDFLGKSFSDVACEYRWIKSISDEIEEHLAQKKSILKEIKDNENSLSSVMAKYPATLYLAAKEIIKHLEK